MELRKKLARNLARAITDFEMLEDGDRVMVAVSGGKDSYSLHSLLTDLTRRAPIRISLVAVNIDQGHPGYPGHILQQYMDERGFDFRMVREDTYSIVTEKVPEGKTYCSLCSRLRRGILYRLATELGCTKIALGHHRDDAIVTLMLNLVFSGQLKAMPPKLLSDDGKHVVIRPLVYCAEDDLAAFAAQEAFPILPCDLCGSQENLQRKVISRLLADLDARSPHARQNMLAALTNVRASHLFDKDLWRALGLRVASAEGDDRDRSADLLPAESLLRGLQ